MPLGVTESMDVIKCDAATGGTTVTVDKERAGSAEGRIPSGWTLVV